MERCVYTTQTDPSPLLDLNDVRSQELKASEDPEVTLRQLRGLLRGAELLQAAISGAQTGVPGLQYEDVLPNRLRFFPPQSLLPVALFVISQLTIVEDGVTDQPLNHGLFFVLGQHGHHLLLPLPLGSGLLVIVRVHCGRGMIGTSTRSLLGTNSIREFR